MVYITGESDERVGQLTDNELELLESRGAQVIVGPGRHDETVEDYLDQGLRLLLGPDLVNR